MGPCAICGERAVARRLMSIRERGRKHRPTRIAVCRECEYNILVLGRTRYERDGEVIELDVGSDEEVGSRRSVKGGS